MTEDYLVKLARQAINHYLSQGKILQPAVSSVPAKYKNKGAVFVTLKKKNKLRGCIGNIISFEPVYKNVIRNAVNAAFNDPRFPALNLKELDNLSISISIIQPPTEFFYHNSDQLCRYLQKNKPGVILRYQDKQTLFLPSVWQELPKCQDFLSALCQKAGLDSDCWQQPGAQVFIFKVQEIEE